MTPNKRTVIPLGCFIPATISAGADDYPAALDDPPIAAHCAAWHALAARPRTSPGASSRSSTIRRLLEQ